MTSAEGFNLVVYVPATHAIAIRAALALSGAGSVGHYDSCSFSSLGVGRFRPLEGSSAFVGEVGRVEEVAEERIEAIVLGAARLKEVLRAVRAAHPYETPAITVTALLDHALEVEPTCSVGAPDAAPCLHRENPAPVSIVLEGLDGVGKSTAARLLASQLKAVQLRTPPTSLLPCRPYFDSRPELRAGYYETGNFIAAAEMSNALASSRSAVCDRFFASTRAYVLARAGELPPPGDAAYDWPAELPRPTHCVQLVLPEPLRIARRALRVDLPETREEAALRSDAAFAGRVVDAYDRLGCTRVSAEGTVEEVVARIRAACGV